MSSPFPIPNISSSPFPFQLPQITQPAGQTSPSPLAPNQNQIGSNGPIFAPSPLSQLISSTINNNNNNNNSSNSNNNSSSAQIQNQIGIGIGSTGLTPSVIGLTPNYGNGITPNTSALLASVGVNLGSTTASNTLSQSKGGQVGNNNNNNDNTKESLIIGLNEIESILNRVESVLLEIREIESRVFGDRKQGDEDKLIALHTEYNQSLQTISTILQISLASSLPNIPCSFSPLSTTATNENENANGINTNQNNDVQTDNINSIQTNLTISDLIKWSEDRASLEFSRKENLKSTSKAILDILKGTSSSFSTLSSNVTTNQR
ncbi:uncharacterized protein L201_002508 [Kwoniella dendrophila CBS 6074]|uniref:Nucleoporin NSP1-like C-terminal domain-containing protein n=1 Tax=Kwoniella dendrophila CBS 6074 TaxID=1295534 RepID=A0AAX4JRU4_9TREE